MRNLFYILILVGLVGCKSCKYTMSGVNIPIDVKTISISYFENKANLVNPLLSQKFTEQLKDKFVKETSLSIVQDNGDYKVSGYISNYEIKVTGISSNTGATKNQLEMTVNVNFECEKHKEKNFVEPFKKFVEFDASKNFQQVENELSDELNRQIIQIIFNKIALDW